MWWKMKSVILLRDPENPEEERLWSRFQDVTKRVNDPKAGADGSMAYSIAYQQLVRAGLVQQIKKKYR